MAVYREAVMSATVDGQDLDKISSGLGAVRDG